MYEIQTLDYNGQKVRITQIEGNRWYSLCDVCKKVLGFVHFEKFSKNLNIDEKKKVSVLNSRGFGGMQMYFINEKGLLKVLELSGRPEAEDFKRWLTNEVGVDFTEIQTNVRSKVSIQASLQKAQMLIRIAENKAVPHSEQLRLLDMAVQELTGAGLNTNEVLSIRQSVEKIVRADITDLPEVVGFIQEKETKDVNGCLIDFLPADMMALKWRTPNEHDTFSGEDFSELADEYGYKTSKYGFWQRVMTPQGEAREFMYIDGTMLDYLCKKYQRVA